MFPKRKQNKKLFLIKKKKKKSYYDILEMDKIRDYDEVKKIT